MHATLPRTIPLHRGTLATAADRLHHAWSRLQSGWQAYRARRIAEATEHELLQLDPRTLRDIGAPEGLVGQQRWQDEERQARGADRMLDLRGW